MPDLITRARLAEIKARTTMWSLDTRTQDLTASYEQAVELLRQGCRIHNPEPKVCRCSACTFVEEFDHD